MLIFLKFVNLLTLFNGGLLGGSYSVSNLIFGVKRILLLKLNSGSGECDTNLGELIGETF